jgi:hypothetical protein
MVGQPSHVKQLSLNHVCKIGLIPLFATGVTDTGGKFAAGVVDTGGKIAASINNTGGKLATGINSTSETGGKICRRCRCEHLREFSKKFETALMVYSGAWGKLIHEKTRSKKSRDTVPLNLKFETT